MNEVATQTLKENQAQQDQQSTESASNKSDRFPALSALGLIFMIGTYFGIVLTKSEVVKWERVHNMFLFKEAHMYLIIGMGVFVAMISMLLIKKLGIKTVKGDPIKYQPKPFHTGVILGGMLFGAGWAITGACPGPIYAQIGGGAWIALFTLAGGLIGMYLYALLKPKLPH